MYFTDVNLTINSFVIQFYFIYLFSKTNDMPTLEEFAKFDLKSFLDSLSDEEIQIIIKYLKDKGII